MPTLTLIRGLPGSGKSTLAKRLLASGTCMDRHFEADMYFTNEIGEYHFDPLLLSDAHEWCQKMTEDALSNGCNVIVSNTFTTRRELQPYLDMAHNFGIEPNIILMQGDYGSIHGVPDHTIRRMRERFQYDIHAY